MNVNPWYVSYWQIGCDDAKAGKPMDPAFRTKPGYLNGYHFGEHGEGRPAPWLSLDLCEMGIEPPEAKRPTSPTNPYMAGIETIEAVLEQLQEFTKEHPTVLDREQVEDYTASLLEARDTLHRFRQAEMGL